jgi:Tfp pilus assembly protein PilV
MKRILRLQAGSLYLELLVGMVILGIGFLAIVPMFVLSARVNTSAADKTFAAQLAGRKAEEFRIMSYGALVAGTGQDYRDMHSIRYLRSWTIQQDTPHPGMKKVTITVRALRNSGYGNSRVMQVSFYRVQ